MAKKKTPMHDMGGGMMMPDAEMGKMMKEPMPPKTMSRKKKKKMKGKGKTKKGV